MTTTIGSFEDALGFLEQYSGIRESDAPMPNFSNEFAAIKMDITGVRYHSSIPSELARGLWEFQEALYKAVALAIYGVEDIRRLTNDQRHEFELVFKVSEGSTGIEAHLEAFLHKLSEGFLTMDSQHKAYVLVLIATILVSGWAATSIVETQADLKKEEIRTAAQIQQETEKTKQFQLFSELASKGVAAAFTKASEEGARSIVRRTPDAREITIGRARIDRADIEEVNRRASMEKSFAEIVREDFRVFGTYAKDISTTKYTLARNDGSEFTVVVSHEDHKPEELEKIWAAARDRKPIALEVNLTTQRGTIKAAQIVRVF